MASESRTRTRQRSGLGLLTDGQLDAAVTVLSLLMVAGIALDARAHAEGISFAEEGFLTPEHAFFYTAFLGIAAVIGATTYANRRAGADWIDAVPEGYGAGIVGVAVFGFGGVGDFLWHSTFGFEQGTEALTSPTHLMLGLGAVLFLASPLRAAWRRAERPTGIALLPALLSSMLALAIIGLFSGIINPVANPRVFDPSGLARQLGVAGFMTFPAVLTGVALSLARRFDLPPGGITLVFLGPVAMTLAIRPDLAPLVTAFVVAGLVADVLAQLLPPTEGLSVRLFAAAVPLGFSGAYMAVAALVLSPSIAWTVHIWAGAVMLSILGGLLVSYIAVPDGSRVV